MRARIGYAGGDAGAGGEKLTETRKFAIFRQE